MIRKVCWMYYKFDGKFMIKYFTVYLKIRLPNYVKVSYYVLFIIAWKEKMMYFCMKVHKLF